jgi:hypothetical protein
LLAASLTGCAHRDKTPPPPPPVINRLAMLSVLMDNAAAVPTAVNNSNRTVPYVPTARPGSPGIGAGAVIGAAVVVGVMALVEQRSKQRRSELDQAMATLDFRPAERLTARLPALLSADTAPVDLVPHNLETIGWRDSQDFRALAESADAVIDVHIDETGYYESSRAGGYSPMLGIGLSLKSVATGRTLTEFSYWFDWRPAKDPRSFQSPPELVFRSLGDLTAEPDKVRAGLEAELDKIAVVMAADVAAFVRSTRPASPAP